MKKYVMNYLIGEVGECDMKEVWELGDRFDVGKLM